MRKNASTIRLIRQLEKRHLTVGRGPLPRQQHPTALQLDYYNAIKPVMSKARGLLQRDLFPHLQTILDANAAAREDSARYDVESVAARLAAVAKKMMGLLEPKQLYYVAHRVGQATSDFQKAQLGRVIRAGLGVDLNAIEPAVTSQVAAFAADNVKLITSIPTQYFSQVENVVTAAVKSGERWENLADKLDARYNVGESRAKLIARDQVGKFYGDLNAKRQEALGVSRYTWRTSNDERVRDDHVEREGLVFEWSEAPEDGHPGEPVNCRCYAEPDFSDIVEGLSVAP